MAEDVAHLPATGITPVICGDAHLGNFGFYASPERDLVMDLNDFDEAHPGGWEWDLRRLAASIWVAGRQNGAAEAKCQAAVASCVAAYRAEVRMLAEQPLLSRSYQRLDVDRLQATASRDSLRAEIGRVAMRARLRTSDRALPRFTEQHEGMRRIVEEPPPGGSRKNTKKWCRGKVGVQHKLECRKYNEAPSALSSSWRILVCAKCGKHFDYYYPSSWWKQAKPDWVTE